MWIISGPVKVPLENELCGERLFVVEEAFVHGVHGQEKGKKKRKEDYEEDEVTTV